jgi:hypothetical protein
MRVLLVEADKIFRITIPDDAKVTFGPFSPPTKGRPYGSNESRGTLRIYQGSKDNIIACFAGVSSFRELSMQYAEQVAKEEGATIWKDDDKGYTREHKSFGKMTIRDIRENIR